MNYDDDDDDHGCYVGVVIVQSCLFCYIGLRKYWELLYYVFTSKAKEVLT